ncbi:MAG: TonB-dependent receptor, partial [Chitinophagaceae bacterium]
MRKILSFQKTALSLFLLFFTISFVQAQTGTIKGVVRDERGPLAGASVSVSSNKGTTTNDNGEYELKVAPGKYTVSFTYAGYQLNSNKVDVGANETATSDVTLVSSSTVGEDIVLVGTRSSGRSKLSTSVPVDVVSARELKSYAQIDAAQALTYVAPSFQSARQVISDGTDHIDPAGLRGLGPDQTLVLVNGKRRHNTALVNINGTVGRGSVGTDLNAIPVAAIERIEVLRDGAAAQYGSDAIAGVINIVLKKTYTGLNISSTLGGNITHLDYNNTTIHDGRNIQLDFYGGDKIGNKGGHFVISGQYVSRERSNRSGNDNIPLLYYGNGGAFPNTPTTTPATDPVAFRRWLIDLDKQTATQRGYDRHNIVAGNSKSNNAGFFLNGGIPLGEKSEFYFTGGFGYRQGDASGFSRNPNAFTQQPVFANGSLYYPDGFLPSIYTRINDRSAITGIKTKFGDWDFDVSNTFGTNKIKYNIKNTGNASLPGTAIAQTQFDAGGVKFTQNTTNLDFSKKFNTTGSTKSFNLAFGTEFRYEQYEIITGEVNSYVNGGRLATIPSLPPYPVNGAVVTFSPSAAAAGSQVFPGFGPKDALKKHRTIIAGYVDGEINLGKLLLGAAGRYEKYSDFGDGLGGKITARVDVTNNFALRGSTNAGFRAPSLHQRYFQNTSTQFVNGLPSQSLTANNDNSIVRNVFGIQSLKPETSTSYSAGIVSKIGSGLSITVDGYYIKIKDRIVLSSAFNKSNPLVNPLLTPFPDVNVLQFWTNAVDTRTKGVDVVVTERFRLGSGNATFSVAANFNDNEVTNLKTNSKIDDAANNPGLTDNTKNPANDFRNALFDRQQRARIEVANPKNKVNITLNYQVNKLDFTVRTVRFGESQYVHQVDPKAINSSTGLFFNDVGQGTDQTFSAKWITDFVINYKILQGFTLGVGANNIFDVYPDRVFIDPRNDPATVYNNPVVAGANQLSTGYGAGRDNSNRGRFLYRPEQFGYNGR